MSTPATALPRPTSAAVALLAESLAIANRAVIADIETEGVRVDLGDGLRWYDTRPMFDPREHADEVIEMLRQAIAYAEAAGIAWRSADTPHLVCLTPAFQ